jgi:transcription antitermination factor NusG
MKKIKDSLNWYAIYTKPRHEKSVNNLLTLKKIKSFLPLKEVLKRWKDRQQKVSLPVFPGYLFVKIAKDKFLEIIKTPGIVKIVGILNKPVPIPDEQIKSVEILIKSKLRFSSYPYLKKGDKVLIRSGPLKGAIGMIEGKKKKNKLIISVDLIGQSVVVEIDGLDVEYCKC